MQYPWLCIVKSSFMDVFFYWLLFSGDNYLCFIANKAYFHLTLTSDNVQYEWNELTWPARRTSTNRLSLATGPARFGFHLFSHYLSLKIITIFLPEKNCFFFWSLRKSRQRQIGAITALQVFVAFKKNNIAWILIFILPSDLWFKTAYLNLNLFGSRTTELFEEILRKLQNAFWSLNSTLFC